MSTIVLRSVKGTPLTNTEVDTNFSNLNTDKIEIGGTYSSGTANGVLFLNSSKVLTTGSALTFDGTNLALTTTGAIYKVPTAGGSLFDAGGNNGIYILGSSNYVATYVAGSEQMRLDSTGLGIGTSSPSFKLDVSGANAQSIRVTSTNGDLANLVMNSTGNASWSLSSDTVMRFRKDSTEYMRLDSSGNLGIGTSSPWAKLSLAMSNGQMGLANGNTSGGVKIQAWNAAGNADGYLAFEGYTKEYARFDSSGNLGVGTSNPAAFGLFAINGASASANINASTGSAALKFYEGSGTGRGSITSLNGSDGLAFLQGTTEGMRLTSTGLGIGTSSPASYDSRLVVESNGRNTGLVVGDLATPANDTSVYWRTTGTAYFYNAVGGSFAWKENGGTERMRLDSSGNLGLGVTPSAWGSGKGFEIGAVGNGVWGGSGFLNLMQNTAFTSGAYRYVATATAARHEIEGNVFKWFTAPSGTAGNAISFTQAMTLDASGNLGVGTTSASTRLEAYTLDVSGTRTNPVDVLTISAAATTASYAYNGFGAALVFKAANYTTTAPVTAARIRSSLNDNSVSTDGSSIAFDVTATRGGALYQAMELNYAGNLGLGVTPSADWASSGYKAAVVRSAFLAGGSGAGLAVLGNNAYNDGGGWRYVATGVASYYVQNAGTHSWSYAPSGTAGDAISFTQAMTLDASGNFGLGTTTTSPYRLNVLRSDGKAAFMTDGATADFAITCISGVSMVAAASTGVLALGTSGTERARIDSSGNLLVGTTSRFSTERLSVNQTTAGAQALYTKNLSGDFNFNCWNAAPSGDNQFIQFITEASPTSRGSITYNRGAGLVAYNTTSDYRAKDIIGPVADSGALIDSVPVYIGKMKGATQERPMFIAHETPAYAHTGEKDAVDADGNPVYQQMDASALIPVMWAEIQSLRQRLAAAGI